MDRGGRLSTLTGLLDSIRGPSNLAHQIASIKQLKNDIVGHDLRKELVVRQGLLDVLVKLLGSAGSSPGHKRQFDVNGATTHTLSERDELRLQAILIVGTLANGGSSFVAPLLAAGVPQVLLGIVADSPSPRLVLATLQALKSLAASWVIARDATESPLPQPLAIFPPNSSFIPDILSHGSNAPSPKQHIRLVADIIALAAVQDVTRAALTECHVLDHLSALLVSYAVAHDIFDGQHTQASLPPAPTASALPSILSAVAQIVAGSTYRAQSFLFSPALRSLFLNTFTSSGDQRHLLSARHGFVSYGKPQLPPLHVPSYSTTTYTGVSRAFPPLANLQSDHKRNLAGLEALQQGGDPDHANAVCSYLIVLARALPDNDRIAALRLLARVNNAIDTDIVGHSPRNEFIQKTAERHKQIAVLAVPLVVQLIQTANETKGPVSSLTKDQLEAQAMREDALEVLALLVAGKQELQTAAVDAGAIKHVCPTLKKSFDATPVTRPMWNPKQSTPDENEVSDSCKLGDAGLPQEVLHAMRCRRTALEAISALAAKEDLHRKAIVDAGVVPCIIDSLKPFPADYFENLDKSRGSVNVKDGNTLPVILAACSAARSMSRSVAALRTSLIDAGLGKPILSLLTHPEIEVQIAATNVCANLVLEFSVMREDFVNDPNTIKTLAEHARSSAPALRLPSLWALKHLVLSTTKEIKLSALDEIEAGWLVGAIQGEQRDIVPPSGGVSAGLSTPNAAGEQVNLLNPSSMDVDVPGTESIAEEDEDGEVMYDESSSTHYQASQLRSTLNPPAAAFDAQKYLSSLREIELNPILRAKRDEVAVQEQALDLVRNLICGDDCSFMFDHLMTQIGSAKIFELLTAKLQPVGTGSHSRAGGRQVYNSTELILSTLKLITNIASSALKHKQLLIAQKQLLQAMVPHFTHPDAKVRVACVWIVISLTWVENDHERNEGRQRAREIKAIGIEAIVRALHNDSDLDVRERVKTALRQLDSL